MNDGTSRRSSRAAPGDTGRAVVQRPHAVEEVRHEPGARVGRGPRASSYDAVV